MSFLATLSQLESATYQPVDAAKEADWYDWWIAQDISNNDPLAVALIGGAAADRLDWVFHAGYQGMMRYAFPFCPKPGWASYLVAEDKTGEFPGAVVSDATLSGHKSWVAAADHVNQLIVRARKADEELLILVDANAAGVTLTSRDKPGFLPAMSQGFAAFEKVLIDPSRVFNNAQLHENFSYAEPLHVLVALNAFMISQTLSLGEDERVLHNAGDTLRSAANLLDANATGNEFFFGIAELDAATTETAQRFEQSTAMRSDELSQRWQQGRGVVNMFSKGLQKRAKWLREG